jgi:glycerol-3-phosphate dehydrogenase
MKAMEEREGLRRAASETEFDVAIIGGGINGACLYHHLARAGFRILLVDQGDFACGTSQASAMMIWGGLLYLQNLRFPTVYKFSAARERMIREMGDWVEPCKFRYVPNGGRKGRGALVRAALEAYWLLGLCRRARPRTETEFPEQAFLAAGETKKSLVYEEAVVRPSDASFVCRWILPHRNEEHVPLNYCRLVGGAYDRASGKWRVELTDVLGEEEFTARARLIVNAAGVWTDKINERFRLRSPFRHILSKGVFIGLERPAELTTPLIFDIRTGTDCMALLPWGSAALWGPTETVVEDLEEGFTVQPADVRTLLDELNRHLNRQAGPADIISLRSGVRPLLVPRDYRLKGGTLALSRRTEVHEDGCVPWISIYGGKITGCIEAAESVKRRIEARLRPSGRAASKVAPEPAAPAWECFPGLRDKVPSAARSVEREMCYRLEDYLRRRTNISQWVPRGGLGRKNENSPHLERLAALFPDCGPSTPSSAVAAYRRQIEREFDAVLAKC